MVPMVPSQIRRHNWCLTFCRYNYHNLAVAITNLPALFIYLFFVVTLIFENMTGTYSFFFFKFYSSIILCTVLISHGSPNTSGITSPGSQLLSSNIRHYDPLVLMAPRQGGSCFSLLQLINHWGLLGKELTDAILNSRSVAFK